MKSDSSSIYGRPSVSVIIPVYNSEKFLQRCVDAVLKQTFKDFELLLIDDGSEDRSLAICKNYTRGADRRIRVFHKENGGVSSARNLGLENANGEWIAFADSDDEVKENWLEILWKNRKIDSDKNVDIVVSGYKIICNDGSGNFDYGLDLKGDLQLLYPQLQGMKMFGSLWNKLFQAAVIRTYNIQMNTNLTYREDEEFVLRYLSYCHTCCCVSTPTYIYYEPDWEKYKYTNFELSGFDLEISRLESLKRLSVTKPFIRKAEISVTNRMLFNSKTDKKGCLRYLRKYFSSVGIVRGFALLARFSMYKFRIIKHLDY